LEVAADPDVDLAEGFVGCGYDGVLAGVHGFCPLLGFEE
jgi:hypothetical protein